MTDHDDSRIRDLLHESHRRLDPPVPPFSALLRPGRRGSSVTARLSPLALAALLTFAIVAGAAWLIDRGRRMSIRDGEALRLAAELGDWEAPTDFLLQTPGLEYLREAPRFGAAIDDLPGGTTRPTAKERIQ